MGMAAILVMWPGLFEQTFVPPSHGDFIWNLASIGPVVSEEKMFKECGRLTDRRRMTEAYLSYKLTNEPSLGELTKIELGQYRTTRPIQKNSANTGSYWPSFSVLVEFFHIGWVCDRYDARWFGHTDTILM